MATGTATLTATATSAVTLSNPVSLDELQLLGTPTINVDATVPVEGLMGLTEGKYVIVEPTTTATTNGTRLLAAYVEAKALTGLTATSRAVVLVPPGEYDLGASSLTLDTQYVDVIGLGNSPRTVVLKNTANNPITLNTTDAQLSGMWCYGRVDVTSSDTTNVIRDCVIGVTGGTLFALGTNDTFVADCHRVRFESVGRSTNYSILGGIYELCEFEGSNTLYVQAGTQMRYCTVEVTLNAAGATATKVYHSAFVADPFAGNLTNDIATPYNVVDSDIAI